MAKSQGSYDDRVSQLAKRLTQYEVGGPEPKLVAYGLLDKLRRHCWERHTDIIGSNNNIIAIVGWSGWADGVVPLAAMLAEAGLIHLVDDGYCLPCAVKEAPEFVRQRWRRADRLGFTQATKRAASGAKMKRVKTEDLGMFAEAAAKPPKSPKKKASGSNGQAGHHELIQHFCDQWEAKYGAKYPFQGGKDASCISSILKKTGGLEAAKQVVDAFLADRDRFYAGHPLNKLVYALPRFVAASGHGAASKDDGEYAGWDSNIPLYDPTAKRAGG